MNTLICIAKALKVPVAFVTEEEIPLLDDYLKEIYDDSEDPEERRKLWRGSAAEKRKQREKMKFHIDTMDLYDTSNCFYAKVERRVNKLNQGQGGIFSFADLILYLPLCEPQILLDSLRRIGGKIAGDEEYIINQFSYVYKKIPDIPAKRFADCQSAYLPLARKVNLTAEEQKKKTKLEAFIWRENHRWTDGYKIGCSQYQSLLARWDQFFAENAIKQFWKSMFPELQRK